MGCRRSAHKLIYFLFPSNRKFLSIFGKFSLASTSRKCFVSVVEGTKICITQFSKTSKERVEAIRDAFYSLLSQQFSLKFSKISLRNLHFRWESLGEWRNDEVFEGSLRRFSSVIDVSLEKVGRWVRRMFSLPLIKITPHKSYLLIFLPRHSFVHLLHILLTEKILW